MPKYSFNSKNSKEYIKTVNANNIAEATNFFAKLKDLPINKFLQLYEVIER